MLHVTTAMNLSSGLSPLLHLLIISLATQYTDSPKHWRWDFGMLKRGGNWTFQITNKKNIYIYIFYYYTWWFNFIEAKFITNTYLSSYIHKHMNMVMFVPKHFSHKLYVCVFVCICECHSFEYLRSGMDQGVAQVGLGPLGSFLLLLLLLLLIIIYFIFVVGLLFQNLNSLFPQ